MYMAYMHFEKEKGRREGKGRTGVHRLSDGSSLHQWTTICDHHWAERSISLLYKVQTTILSQTPLRGPVATENPSVANMPLRANPEGLSYTGVSENSPHFSAPAGNLSGRLQCGCLEF